jgi:acid phosphatase
LHFCGERYSSRLIPLALAAVLLAACARQSQPAGPATFAPPAIATAGPSATVRPPEPPTAAPPTLTAPPAASPTPEFDPFAAALPTAESEFSIPPAFQRVTEDSAVLYFALDPPTAGAVLYRSGASPLQAIPFDAAAERHVVTLPGLTPATIYDVLVVVGAEPEYSLPRFLADAWGSQTVATPPYPEPLRFAALADSGFGDPITAALAERLADEAPDFVLLPGDVVYRMDEQRNPGEAYRLKYFQPFAPVLRLAPIYPALGNHELDGPGLVDGTPYYYTAFPPVFDSTFPNWNGEPLRKWYAFAANGVQFLSVNTQALFGDPGRAEQEAWLEERLADPAYGYTVAFFHVPPYSSGPHRFDGLNVRPLADRLEAAGVPLAISGHEHVYERLAHGPTTYIISGGGSGTTYDLIAPNEFSQYFDRVSHYTLFEAYPDRIEMRAVDVDGEIVDQAVIVVSP